METNRFNLVILLTAFLFLGVFENTPLFAKETTILERVRKVEDPELAKLIQIAIDNLPESRRFGGDEQTDNQLKYEEEMAKAKVIRTVTEKYAQIKLLDNKLDELEKKIEESKSTQDVKSELMIAKVCLESEQLSCIAELREALNLVPWTPFGPKDVRELNTWLHLEVLDNTVRALNLYKPGVETLCSYPFSNVSNFKTPQKTIIYVEDIIKDCNVLPIRITFAATDKGYTIAKELQDKIKSLIQNRNIEYETDLSTKISVLKEKSIRVVNHNNNQVIELSHPNHGLSIENYILEVKNLLQHADSLPLVIEIQPYREELKEDNIKLTMGLSKMIEDFGLKDYVTIKAVSNQN